MTGAVIHFPLLMTRSKPKTPTKKFVGSQTTDPRSTAERRRNAPRLAMAGANFDSDFDFGKVLPMPRPRLTSVPK